MCEVWQLRGGQVRTALNCGEHWIFTTEHQLSFHLEIKHLFCAGAWSEYCTACEPYNRWSTLSRVPQF